MPLSQHDRYSPEPTREAGTIMPDTTVSGEPSNAPSQHWPDAIGAMLNYAEETGDALLRLLALQAGAAMDSHWGSSAGCGSCHGDVDYCSEWDRTQEIVVTWLMQRAGLA